MCDVLAWKPATCLHTVKGMTKAIAAPPIVGLPAQLARARRDAGLSYAGAADRIGCSEGAIRRYERGERQPSLTVLVHLAEIYGVEPAALLGGRRHVAA